MFRIFPVTKWACHLTNECEWWQFDVFRYLVQLKLMNQLDFQLLAVRVHWTWVTGFNFGNSWSSVWIADNTVAMIINMPFLSSYLTWPIHYYVQLLFVVLTVVTRWSRLWCLIFLHLLHSERTFDGLQESRKVKLFLLQDIQYYYWKICQFSYRLEMKPLLLNDQSLSSWTSLFITRIRRSTCDDRS